MYTVNRTQAGQLCQDQTNQRRFNGLLFNSALVVLLVLRPVSSTAAGAPVAGAKLAKCHLSARATDAHLRGGSPDKQSHYTAQQQQLERQWSMQSQQAPDSHNQIQQQAAVTAVHGSAERQWAEFWASERPAGETWVGSEVPRARMGGRRISAAGACG